MSVKSVARVVIGVVVLLVAILAVVVTFFGQDVRALFATSTASLSGNPSGGNARYTRGSHLKEFGKDDKGLGGGKYGGYRGGGDAFVDPGLNPVVMADADRYSTFAIDVDTASYSWARRAILEGRLPPRASVRVEEFVNAFNYDYDVPRGEPFAVHLDAAPSPFTPGRVLVRVGLQAARPGGSSRPPAHLVFLVDVSGSMRGTDRLELAKKAMHIALDNLRDGDTVAIVTYAGSVEEVLAPTSAGQRDAIRKAIDSLEAGGSTSMGDGLGLAYRLAARTLSPESISRVLVLTDGDANVGEQDQEGLRKIIAGRAKEGVTLTACGFGSGNLRDDLLERLADTGNGQYVYVDSEAQARKVFRDGLDGTLQLVAQDVKVQVEFDPATVATWRLVGYENRALAREEFRNDAVDAGDLGAGQSATAIYEVTLTDRPGAQIATTRVRWKLPRGAAASEKVFTLARAAVAPTFDEASADLRFATAVAWFGEHLRASPHAVQVTLTKVAALAADAVRGKPERREFVGLVERVVERDEVVARR